MTQITQHDAPPTGTFSESEQPRIDGDWQLVVRSVGRANADVLGLLDDVVPFGRERLAQILYRAPAVLVRGLAQDTAQEMGRLLRQAGLDCDAAHRSAPLEPGQADHELALVVPDPSIFNALLGLVVQALGVRPDDGIELLCGSPTVLAGGLSKTSGEALAERFRELGAQTVLSHRPSARYDLFCGPCPPAFHRRLISTLQVLGLAVAAEGQTPRVAENLSWQEAERIWPTLQAMDLPLRMLNRDMQRFDLWLDAAGPSPAALGHWLMGAVGMPAEAVPQVLQELPVVLRRDMPLAEAEHDLTALARRGARGRAELTAFQTFDLQVDRADGVLNQAARLCERLGALKAAGVDAAGVEATLRRGGRLEGPLSGPRARWLRHELRKLGVSSELVLR